MSTAPEHLPTERRITRLAIETSVALAWNAEGAIRGLPPLAWQLGGPWRACTSRATPTRTRPRRGAR
ncbi:hypothetical protein BC477_05280 [Clavibacter michiganensis subsp. michiganensis]|uniref:Uncharacterized protein n=1 Tax=Clavibacter michiganensis subsp. michiganensis TaxID=33013 RepID=A0A251XLR1_CLAMM|nr:hypothetical protein BC477_05280 [Clavibacter michiganensis subsp. michiganensis]OUE04129.1 hypothetical protein CMMCAS07_04210 [Clavibacter michiganensis subsp. michiganensis]